MIRWIILIVAVVLSVCFSFGVGLLVGHKKYFPFEPIYELIKGRSYNPPPPRYHGRFFDESDRTPVSVSATNSTGIYLTYGQSNSANSGEFDDKVYEHVFQYFLDHVYLYEDPSLGTTGSGGSVWGKVGHLLVENGAHDQVIFANAGWGGLSIRELKGGQYLRYLVFNYRSLVQRFGRVDAILFHQGESDNDPNRPDLADEYEFHFREMLANLHDMGVNIPIYLSRVSHCGTNRPSNNDLINVQNKLINEIEYVYDGPNTDLLTARNMRRSDYCHFSIEGNEKHAQQWFSHLAQR